jgi:hypothetical protein
MDIAGEIVSGADQSRGRLVRFQALSVSKIETKRPAFAGDFEMELAGLEPATSWVRSRFGCFGLFTILRRSSRSIAFAGCFLRAQ